MPRSHHTYSGEIEMSWEHYHTTIQLEIDFYFEPGYPGRGPDLTGPGAPPEPPEVEITEIRGLTPRAGEAPSVFEIPQVIRELLCIDEDNDTLYESLVEYARSNGGEE